MPHSTSATSPKKITQDVSRGTTWAAQPPPPLDSYPSAEFFFFSKCRRGKGQKKIVKINKNTPGRLKGRRKKNLEICDHMAQRVPKTPPKNNTPPKRNPFGTGTSSPFDMWRQPKQKSLWYRAILMPVAPNYGSDTCP